MMALPRIISPLKLAIIIITLSGIWLFSKILYVTYNDQHNAAYLNNYTTSSSNLMSWLQNTASAYLNIASAQTQNEPVSLQDNAEKILDAAEKSLADDDEDKQQQEIERIFKGYQDYIDLAPNEIRLLYELTRRRQELDERENTINERETILLAIEKRVKESNLRLAAIKDEVQGLLQVFDDSFAQERKKLQQVYANMKPADAARIFNNLDINTLSLIFADMKPRDVAPILGKMDVDKARAITNEFIESNKETLSKRLRERIESEGNNANNPQ